MEFLVKGMNEKEMKQITGGEIGCGADSGGGCGINGGGCGGDFCVVNSCIGAFCGTNQPSCPDDDYIVFPDPDDRPCRVKIVFLQ